MAWGFGRPSRLTIKWGIRGILRTFTPTHVRIRRRVADDINEHGEAVPSYELVYSGDALVRPAGGTVQTYGLGTVENYSMQVLLNGNHDIRQGDVVLMSSTKDASSREYEIQYPPAWFEAFMSLTLTQRSQIGQPV